MNATAGKSKLEFAASMVTRFLRIDPASVEGEQEVAYLMSLLKPEGNTEDNLEADAMHERIALGCAYLMTHHTQLTY